MGKTVIISNKTYNHMKEVGINYCHDDGNVYTTDRLYGTINETLEYQMRAKNRFLGSFVSYWFQTTDYKKNKKLSNIRPSKSDILFTLFFWACIVGLICCVIWGIAIPIINSAIKSIQLVQGSYTGVLMANNHIIGFVFEGKVVASAISVVSKATSEADAPEWVKQFYEQYWKHNVPTGYQNTFDSMKQYLQTFIIGQLGTASATVTYMPKPLQILMYFNVVGQTLNAPTTAGATNWFPTFDANKLAFALNDVYTKNNPYYGLSAGNVCLAGNQMAQTLLVPQIWIAWFNNAEVIVPLIFTLLLVILVWLYRYLIKKVRPRTNAMSIQDYVMAKVIFAKKWKLLLRKRVPMVEGVKELNHRFLFAAGALGVPNIYFNLRLLNYIYATFREMNIVLVFPFGDNDAGIAELQKIIAQDFQNIDLTIVDDEIATKFSSLDPSGEFFRYGGKPMSQDITDIKVVDSQTTEDLAKIIFRNEVHDFYRELDEKRDAKIKKITVKYGTKSCKIDNNLTKEQKNELYNEVKAEEVQEDSEFIAKQIQFIRDQQEKLSLAHTNEKFKKGYKQFNKKLGIKDTKAKVD